MDIRLLSLAIVSCLQVARAQCQIPAIFTFGDSTVDTGTNNYLPLSVFKANFPPYGLDYIPQSGRFSNGRLVGDYIATYLGIPAAPPFLQPGANFSFGANFASGGATVVQYDVSLTQAVDVPVQVAQFSGLLKLQPWIQGITSKSLFFLSMGANDFIIFSQFHHPNMTEANRYIKLIVKAEVKAIRELYRLGARKFLVTGAGPIGCSPAFAVETNSTIKCLDSVNTLIQAFNMELMLALDELNHSCVPGAVIAYAQPFDLVHNFATSPRSFGFVEGTQACCGAGELRTQVACGKEGVINGKNVDGKACTCRASYVFWDGLHPTECTYKMVAAAMWAGPPNFIAPVNLRQLCFSTPD